MCVREPWDLALLRDLAVFLGLYVNRVSHDGRLFLQPLRTPQKSSSAGHSESICCLGNRLSLSLIFLDSLHSLTQCAPYPASWQSWCHPECSLSSLTWFSISLLLPNINLLAKEFAYSSSSRLHHSAPPKCFLMPLDDHEQGSVVSWDQLSPQLHRDWDMTHLHLHAVPAKTMCWGRCLQILRLMRMGLPESSCWTSVTQGFSLRRIKWGKLKWA